MQPQPGYLSTLCPPGPWGAHRLREMAPEPPSPPRCGPGQNRGPSHQAVPAQRCCAGSCAVGGPWGQLWAAPRPGSPSAPCRGPHHGRETQATITNPTDFSPSLSQRQTPPVPGGFDDHGLMESHRKAHKKRHRLKTGSLWNCNKIPATHNVVQMQDQRAHGQQKNGPKDSHGPVPRSDDMSPVTADGILQEGLSRGP